MDTLVFDIETSNFFTDPGVGWDNFAALKISVVGIYSYLENKYFCYEEGEMDKIAEMFEHASRIVGFASNHYDIPVLNLYFQRLKSPRISLWDKERVDLAGKIEMTTGHRISLSRLAEANLGVKKDHHGSEAIGMFARGEMEKLKEYCIKDVRLTKDLYDLYLKEGHLIVPDRATGELVKVDLRDVQTATLL